MKKQYITLAATFLSLGMTAQTLTKEIVIDRDVEPALPEVTRISNFPSLIQPQAPTSRLPYVDVTAATNIPGMLTTLEPANGQPAFEVSPYRGYATLGYFPAYNLGISAGYSFIAKPTTSLNVWTQFDGYSYDDQYDESLKRNSVTVGADFSHLFNRRSRLDVSADFNYNAYNRPWETADPDHNTTAFNLDAAWSSRLSSAAYYVTAGFNHFGFSGEEVGLSITPLDAVSQNIFKVAAGGAYKLNDHSAFTAHIGFNFINISNFNNIESAEIIGATSITNRPYLEEGKGETIGLITLAPAYRYASGMFSTNIGLKAQISTNADKSFHIAPDVKFNVRPTSTLAATLSFGGGEHINKLSELYAINPYMSVGQGFKFSHVPFTANLALTFGPFYGASIEFFGGYSAANDWFMPDVTDVTGKNGVIDVTDRPVFATMYTPVDLRAVTYGAKFTWKYNKDIEASIKYSGAPGSYRHSYYLNRDRARHVLDINASVTPIEPLTIDASFELRSGRSLYSQWGMPEGEVMKYDLESANSLNIGATYRFFDWLSVFGRVENLLGNQAYLFNMLEQQGVHGLIGASLKF